MLRKTLPTSLATISRTSSRHFRFSSRRREDQSIRSEAASTETKAQIEINDVTTIDKLFNVIREHSVELHEPHIATDRT